MEEEVEYESSNDDEPIKQQWVGTEAMQCTLLIAFTWVHNWMRFCIVLRPKL